MSIAVRREAELLGFPEEAIAALEKCYEKMLAAPSIADDIYTAQELLFCKPGKDFVDALKPIYAKVDESPYSVDMVFLLLSMKPLRYIYKLRGYSEELFVETMKDLLYKLNECRAVYGVWGTFVVHWYQKFYTCERFKLGRLQFETRAYPCDEPFHGIFKKGDTVVGCHIPSCGPLTYESVIDSLKQAYAFYPEMIKDGLLPVYCHSWLMYPPYAGEIFPEGTNLYKFLNLFELVRVEEDEEYEDFFRVFNRPFSEEALSSAPEDTGLQRRLKKFLLDGNKMGTGYGFILFDGERIVTEKK